jgi:RNA polymerase sigma factor (TIGR02999 family)
VLGAYLQTQSSIPLIANVEKNTAEDFAKQVYPLLRSVAANQLRKVGSRLTLSPTEFAHEAFLRVAGLESYGWESKAHCSAFLASVLRYVIVDYVRERTADKRGGGVERVSMEALEDLTLGVEQDSYGLIKVHQALAGLEKLDRECAKIAELKLFSEMDAEKIAQACGVSLATVGRHWRFAKSWLSKEISE